MTSPHLPLEFLEPAIIARFRAEGISAQGPIWHLRWYICHFQ